MPCGGESPGALEVDLSEKLHSPAIVVGSSLLLRQGEKDKDSTGNTTVSASKRKTKVEKITCTHRHTHTHP